MTIINLKKVLCFKTADLVLFCLLIFLQKNTFFTPYYSTWVWEGVVHIFLSLKKFCYVSSKLSSKSLKITTRKQNKLIRILNPLTWFCFVCLFCLKNHFFFQHTSQDGCGKKSCMFWKSWKSFGIVDGKYLEINEKTQNFLIPTNMDC